MITLVLLAVAADPLPAAIRAHQAALAERPWDRRVQRQLESLRERVAYPAPPEPGLRVRPDPPTGLRHRVGPLDLLAASATGSLLLAVGLIARGSVRPPWAGPLAVFGGLLLGGAAGVAVSLGQVEAALVLDEPTALRTGNGPSYPSRLTLPAGAEVRELHRRGGWTQVELAGGGVGWVPMTAVR